MSSAMVLLLASAAMGQDLITDVGPISPLPTGGPWARALALGEGQWALAFTANGGYYRAPLEAEAGGGWSVRDDRKVALNDTSELKDHAIARCPDGSWLHVASANVDVPNDSAYAWRYDEDFGLLASGIVEEREPARPHNDLPLACTELFEGTLLSEIAQRPTGNFFRIGDDAQLAEMLPAEDEPIHTGSSLLRSGDGARLLHLGITPFTNTPMVINAYDDQLQLAEQHEVPLAQPPERAYWPQGALALGEDYVMVAYMVRDDTDPAFSSGDEGDVHVAILDARDGYAVAESRAITDYASRDVAAMRPGLARQGDQVLLTFDAENRPVVVELTLDLGALGVTDDGLPSGGGDDDTASTLSSDEGRGCQAAPGIPAGLIALLLSAALPRRRQRRSPLAQG